jgi:hypothetical protein
MQTTILYCFPATGEEREAPYAVALRKSGDEQFAMVWTSRERYLWEVTATLTFVLLDLKQRTILSEITSAPTYADLDELTLTYDAHRDCWVIVSIEAFYKLLVLRTVQTGQDGHLVFSPSLLVDEDESMSVVGSLLAPVDEAMGCMLVYRKSTLHDTFVPSIWSRRVILPTQVEHEVVIVDRDAEDAILCTTNQSFILLTLAPVHGVFTPGTDVRDPHTDGTYQWHITLLRWDRGQEVLDWKYMFDIGLPVRDRVKSHPFNDLEWLRAEAALIEGPIVPATGRRTFVAGAAMVDITEEQVYGAGIERIEERAKQVSSLCCVDEAGQLMRRYEGPVGLELHLCLAGLTVVGVDVIEQRRRLWNWTPLSEQRQQRVRWLDAEVQRIFVVADDATDEEGRNRFWLVEEYADRVRVSRCDAISLSEVAPAVVLPDIHIPSRQKDWTPLQWDKPVGMLVYRSTLLVLGVDAQQQYLLYQVGESVS